MSFKVLMVCPELPRSDRPGTMAPGARQIESLRRLGVAIEVVDMQGIPKLKYLQKMPRIRRLLGEADLVHAHFGFCGWLAHLSGLLKRKKPGFVISFMGSDLLGTPVNHEGDLAWLSKLLVRANKRLALKPDEVIVKSRQMAEVIAPVGCTVIPNGVDTERFHPINRSKARVMLELPSEQKIVLFPGNPENPRKGYRLACDAVGEASRLVGEEIRLLPLWNVDPGDVPLYMNACDLMLMTSLLEGSPNVVKEAMACDAKVVGVAVGDVKKLISDVAGCELCERSPCSIGKGIALALESQEVRSREAIWKMGLDAEAVAHRILRVYEQAVGQPIELQPDLNVNAGHDAVRQAFNEDFQML